jgi:hypothetical protein
MCATPLVSINPIAIRARVSHGTILFKDISRLNNCRAVGAVKFSSLIFASDTARKEFSIIRREKALRAERLDRDCILEREFY